MIQLRLLALLPAVALLLSGCMAGMVASAVGMAADGGRGRGQPRNNAFMQAAARQACNAHAAQYGAAQIVGVKQVNSDEILVSGIVTDASGRNSFECNFVTQITGFSLQPIQPGS